MWIFYELTSLEFYLFTINFSKNAPNDDGKQFMMHSSAAHN